MRDGIKALIFDKDGTLLDFNATYRSWVDKLLDWGCAQGAVVRGDLAQSIGFNPDTGQFQPGSPVVAETSEAIGAIWSEQFNLSATATAQEADRIATTVNPMPVADLPLLFERFHAAGLRIGLATHDAEEPAHRQLRSLGLGHFFDFVAGYDSGHGHKPGSGMIDAFARHTGCATHTCVMIGDSVHDLGAGRAAGCHSTIGVLTGPARREHLSPLADAILPSIADLPTWLEL